MLALEAYQSCIRHSAPLHTCRGYAGDPAKLLHAKLRVLMQEVVKSRAPLVLRRGCHMSEGSYIFSYSYIGRRLRVIAVLLAPHGIHARHGYDRPLSRYQVASWFFLAKTSAGTLLRAVSFWQLVTLSGSRGFLGMQRRAFSALRLALHRQGQAWVTLNITDLQMPGRSTQALHHIN